jgi:hypothetical protein
MALPAGLKLTKEEQRLATESQKALKARERERTTRERFEHKAYVGIGGAAIGVAERGGYLTRLPSVAGRYPYTTIAFLATLAAFKTKGTTSRVLEGASDAAIAVASYRMAATMSVAGGEVLGAARMSDPTRARELAEVGASRRALQRERRDLAALEERLAAAAEALEAQVAGDQPE